MILITFNGDHVVHVLLPNYSTAQELRLLNLFSAETDFIDVRF